MTITLRAGVLNSGIQQNGTEFLTVDTSNNATLSNKLTVTGVTTLTGGLNAALPVLSGGTGVTTSTGTGAVVLGTSPTLATPTFDSAQLVTISGTAPLYMCRAWVNFNGTGTVAIRASGNVSSITDNGVGVYTPNFTTAMPDVNYARVVQKGNSGGFFVSAGDDVTAPTVSGFRIGVRDTPGTYTDIEYIHVSVFR